MLLSSKVEDQFAMVMDERRRLDLPSPRLSQGRDDSAFGN